MQKKDVLQECAELTKDAFIQEYYSLAKMYFTYQDIRELEEALTRYQNYKKRYKEYVLTKDQKEYTQKRMQLSMRKIYEIMYTRIGEYYLEKYKVLKFKVFREDKLYKTVPLTWLYNKKGVYIILKETGTELKITYIGHSETNLRKTILRHFEKYNDNANKTIPVEEDNQQNRYEIWKNKDKYYCICYLVGIKKNVQVLETIMIWLHKTELKEKLYYNKECALCNVLDKIDEIRTPQDLKNIIEYIQSVKVLRRFFSVDIQAYNTLKEKLKEYEDTPFDFEPELIEKYEQKTQEVKEGVKVLLTSYIQETAKKFLENSNMSVGELIEEYKKIEEETDAFFDFDTDEVPF